MDGDLISRKELLEKLDERDKLVRKLTANVYDEDEIIVTLSAVRKFVNNRPAVDAEPVRHSKWVCRTPGVFSCGACLGLALGNRPTCYCPDCGARMDGEKNEQ